MPAPSTTSPATRPTCGISSPTYCSSSSTARCAAPRGYTGPLQSLLDLRQQGGRREAEPCWTMGQSRPWPEALKSMTGEEHMDATAILDYFAPLKTWLDEQKKGQRIPGARLHPFSRPGRCRVPIHAHLAPEFLQSFVVQVVVGRPRLFDDLSAVGRLRERGSKGRPEDNTQPRLPLKSG